MNNKEIKKYDDKGNCIYHMSDSGKMAFWKEFDNYHRVIHYRHSNGPEFWCKYNKNNEQIFISQQEFLNKKLNYFKCITI